MPTTSELSQCFHLNSLWESAIYGLFACGMDVCEKTVGYRNVFLVIPLAFRSR